MTDAPLPATVLICTRGRPQLACETVESVLAAEHVPAELVVVDQSDEPNPELRDRGRVRGCDVRYIHTHERGLSRARNCGLRAATHDVVVLLDDDMLVNDETLPRLLEARGEQPNGVATGPVLAAAPEQPGRTQAASALHTGSEVATYRGRQRKLVIPGANIAVDRSFVLAAGGYDERLGAGTRFGGGEDHDLALRMLDAGSEVHFVPDAVVLHRSWRDQRELLRQRWAYGRGVGGFFAKWLLRRDRWVLGMVGEHLAARLRGITLARSPRAVAAHVVSLAALAAGAAEWTLRFGRSRR